MSTFENSTPEPKQFFLNLLIKLDFEVADEVFRYKNYSGAINGMTEIITLTCCANDEKLKETAQKIIEYQKNQSAPIDELIPMFQVIQNYLMEKWFSDLKLGVLHTSTVAGTKTPPKPQTFNPDRTSHI